MADGVERIDDDELLCRRIPVAWHDPSINERPSPQAFRPRKDDTSGLSLTREKYHTPEEAAASGRAGKQYFVALVRVGDLRASGIRVEPDPTDEASGHVVLPDLTYETRDSPPQRGMQVRLAEELCLRVEGPFPGQRVPDEA